MTGISPNVLDPSYVTKADIIDWWSKRWPVSATSSAAAYPLMGSFGPNQDPVRFEVYEPVDQPQMMCVSMYVSVRELVQAIRPRDVVIDIVNKSTGQMATAVCAEIAKMPDIQLMVRDEIKAQVRAAVKARLDEIVDDFVESI